MLKFIVLSIALARQGTILPIMFRIISRMCKRSIEYQVHTCDGQGLKLVTNCMILNYIKMNDSAIIAIKMGLKCLDHKYEQSL
jgi:hypothetical protein